MNATVERPIDRWFASYSGDHQNETNQLIHVFAVPAILWSVVALIWCIPPLGTLFNNGIWAALAMFATWMFYNRLSRPIGYGMLVAFFTIGCLCRLLHRLNWACAGLLYSGHRRVRGGVDRAVHRPQDRRQEAELLHRPDLPADRPDLGAVQVLPQDGLEVLTDMLCRSELARMLLIRSSKARSIRASFGLYTPKAAPLGRIKGEHAWPSD